MRKGRLKTGEREETGGTGKKKDKERQRSAWTLGMIRFPISRAHKHKVIQKTKTEILKAAALENQSKMDLMPLPPKQETKSSENQLQLTKTKTQKNTVTALTAWRHLVLPMCHGLSQHARASVLKQQGAREGSPLPSSGDLMAP